MIERLTVDVRADRLDGGYVATVRELPGCASQGETPMEALRNVADAASDVLDVRSGKTQPA